MPASSCTTPRLRLWTVSSKPPFKRFMDMGRPILPRPINPTFILILLSPYFCLCRRLTCIGRFLGRHYQRHRKDVDGCHYPEGDGVAPGHVVDPAREDRPSDG